MEIDTEFSSPEMLGLLSAVVAGLAAFLPWVTTGVDAGPVDVNTSSTGIEGLGLLTLALAIVAIGVILIMDWEGQGTVGTGIIGAVVTIVAVWKVVDIDGAVSPGIGLYLTVVAGLGLVVAGAWGYQTASTETAEETPP